MALRLYNTLSKKEEEFAPLAPPQVTMYTCGPTVYSRPHIGNYASFLMADLLRRWLWAGHGYAVKHVKNITDVGHLLHDADRGDDKIQREAEKENVHPLAIARRHTGEYLEDERALHILEPAHRPLATEYIEHMREMTEALLASGHAYVTGDGVYFDVTAKTPTPYGALSGNTLSAVKAGARVSVKEAKKHPADFALWKFCIGENAHHILRWPSPKLPDHHPFPDGFPGWHIECSAMSRALLGDQIDMHTGGEDNIFPHHECEIAQSESVTGKAPLVRFWLHKRRIEIAASTLRQAPAFAKASAGKQGDILDGDDVSTKMSKSLGNVLSLDDIRERGFDPMDLRYYLLSVHYRTHLKFRWKGMEDARKARRAIVEWISEMQQGKSEIRNPKQSRSPNPESRSPVAYVEEFREAMDADLNTPAALAAVFDCMTWSRTVSLSTDDHAALRNFCDVIRATFGCFDAVVAAIPGSVQTLMDARSGARSGKDFAESDRLRKEMEAMGYEVRDTAEGQVIRKR